jgi:hypothetical protein
MATAPAQRAFAPDGVAFVAASAAGEQRRPGLLRQVLRAAVARLDELLPPARGGPDQEVPPEWFKFPPI